jgi:hypothetical protein
MDDELLDQMFVVSNNAILLIFVFQTNHLPLVLLSDQIMLSCKINFFEHVLDQGLSLSFIIGRVTLIINMLRIGIAHLVQISLERKFKSALLRILSDVVKDLFLHHTLDVFYGFSQLMFTLHESNLDQSQLF